MLGIQAKGNLPHHFDAACALYGAEELSLSYQLIEEINEINPHITYVGTVEFLMNIMCKLQVKIPHIPNSDRPYLVLPLKEALSLGKVFIKPLTLKLFTGFLYEGYSYSCLKDIPLDTPVYVYDPLEIISEWRVYIHKGDILGVYHYSGNPLVFPSVIYLNHMSRLNLIAYTIDVGVLKDGSNVIVEYNDMWAIGNYGLPNWLYTRALIDRWKEICS